MRRIGWWWKLLEYVGSRLKKFDIIVDGNVYLRRHFLRRGHDRPSLYLHEFYQSDPDRGLHNHPAKLGVGLLLAGRYFEDRYISAKDRRVVRRELRAPALNIIRAKHFHRIVLAPGEKAWTLFFRTKRYRKWGFLSRNGVFTLADPQ